MMQSEISANFLAIFGPRHPEKSPKKRPSHVVGGFSECFSKPENLSARVVEGSAIAAGYRIDGMGE